MKYYVEFHVPGSFPQRHVLFGDRLTLGSGTNASIRVPESCGFVAEQVELYVDEQGTRVQLPTGVHGPLVFEGKEHRSVRVPWGGEVFIGNVRLTFLKGSANNRTSPILLLLAPVALIVLGLGAYQAGSRDDAAAHDVPAPPLLDEHQNSYCQGGESSIAERRARDDERAALAKQERSAFDATDGVDAVLLFRNAKACFQMAGKAQDASRVADELTRWSSVLNEQYATLGLRMRLALDKQRPADALAAVKELQALLAHQQETPYRQWLAQLARSLEQKIVRAGS